MVLSARIEVKHQWYSGTESPWYPHDPGMGIDVTYLSFSSHTVSIAVRIAEPSAIAVRIVGGSWKVIA